MKKILTAVAAMALSISLVSGCNAMTSSEDSFYCMHTMAQLVISDNFDSEKKEKFSRLATETEQTLQGVENSISTKISTSSISKFNLASAGEKVELDETAYEVLSLAKEVYSITGGYFNPAIYYNVQAYGFNEGAEEYTIPADGLIEKYNSVSEKFGEIKLSEEGGRYYAVKPEAVFELDGVTYPMKIDLDGIGKGYAADLVGGLIKRYGFTNGHFDFGDSNILCKKFKGGEYTLNLNDPRAYGSMASIMVKDVSLSTSGDYRQFFERDGIRYCHIFDPVSGKPIQTGIMTATVIGGTGAMGDALTTAIMAMGKERAVEFINEKLDGLKVVFACVENGEYEIITNVPSELKNIGKNYKIANTVQSGKIILGEG